MKYWFGYRYNDIDGKNPGSKCLSDSCASYEIAKELKQRETFKGMEKTEIFTATTEAEAILLLEKYSFLKF